VTRAACSGIVATGIVRERIGIPGLAAGAERTGENRRAVVASPGRPARWTPGEELAP
jgi:hypothetical protein